MLKLLIKVTNGTERLLPGPPREKSQKGRLIALMVFVIVCSNGALFGSEFVVDGLVTFQLTNAAGFIGFLREDSFSLHVRDCYWRLRQVPIRFIDMGK